MARLGAGGYCCPIMKKHRSTRGAGTKTGIARTTADIVRLNGQLLQELAHAIAANEKVQSKFRYAVVSKLARIGATVAGIHAVQFVLAQRQEDPRFEENIQKSAKGAEEFIARQGKVQGLKMIRYIYGPDTETTERRDRRRRWSGWEI